MQKIGGILYLWIKPLKNLKHVFIDNIMFSVCIAFLIIGAALSPNFFTVTNIFSVLRQMSIVGILAAAQSIAIITGGIDVSLGGLLSSTVVVISLVQFLPFPLVVIIALLFSFSFGSITGFTISYGRIAAFIASLGMGTVGDGLALLLTEGRPVFIRNNLDIFQRIGGGYIGFVPFMVLIFAVVVFCGQLILSQTSLGFYWRSIGGNEEATYWSGINTRKYKLLGYATSGTLAGIASLLAVARTGVGDPVVGQGLALDSISAAVLGGTYLGGGGVGSVIGALLGAFILGVINNLFNLMNISAYWQLVTQGGIIILAVFAGGRVLRKKN
jgi:ribose/xylose/arabinose/galactoside ABC-type transport system permease subunit